MCRFFGVSRSGYYDYVKRMDIPAWDLPLAEKIRSCQESCGQTYGYRRVHIWLEKQGVYRNPKTVLRVMRKYGLLSVIRRKNTAITAIIFIVMTICWTEIFMQTDQIKSGLQIFHTYTPNKAYCIFQSFGICMTIALLLTRPAQSRMSTLYFLQSEQPRKRESHCRVAAPQWPRLSIHISSVF